MSDIEPFFGEHQRALLPSRVAEKIGPVDPDTGCWPWLASTNNGGYGRVRWFGRKAFAHRLVFHLAG